MSGFYLRDKNILLISPEPWDHIFVSKHHYAVHLAARGNRVYFLNPPSRQFSIRAAEYKNLFIIDYRGFLKGLRYLPRFLQGFFMKRVFISIEKAAQTRFDVIWSFDNSVFFDFGIFAKGVVTISHIVDLNQNFNTEIAARSASLCCCTTDLIRDRLVRYSTNVFKINHGFNNTPICTSRILPGQNVVKAVYSGNLNMPFIDWEILYGVVNENPEVDFVFIGPGFDQIKANKPTAGFKERVLELPNSYGIGQIKAQQIPEYLEQADILLVCYLEKYHSDQANPHKIMEYLGSGKVIVATDTAEYRRHDDIIVMARKNQEFLALFRTVKDNIQQYNNIALMQARKNVAIDNTYEKQINRIERLIYVAE